MGLDLCLFVKPAPRVVTAWEGIYRRTLHILERTLLRTRVVGRNSPRERWGCGEFTLFRHGTTQFTGEIATSRDLLWSAEDDGLPGPGHAVLAGTARDEDVYSAVLVATTLVEMLLGENAFVHGHITRHSWYRALTRCRATSDAFGDGLDLPVSYTPLCTRGEELLKRLLSAYDDEDGASRRFAALFPGSQREVYAVLVKNVAPRSVDKLFIRALGTFASLSQVGARETVCAFFEATGDIDRTITLVGRVNAARPGFASPMALLQTLAARGITVKPADRVPPESPPGQGRVRPPGRDVESPRNFVLQYLEEQREDLCTSRYVDPRELIRSFSPAAADVREYMEAVVAREERRFRPAGT